MLSHKLRGAPVRLILGAALIMGAFLVPSVPTVSDRAVLTVVLLLLTLPTDVFASKAEFGEYTFLALRHSLARIHQVLSRTRETARGMTSRQTEE